VKNYYETLETLGLKGRPGFEPGILHNPNVTNRHSTPEIEQVYRNYDNSLKFLFPDHFPHRAKRNLGFTLLPPFFGGIRVSVQVSAPENDWSCWLDECLLFPHRLNGLNTWLDFRLGAQEAICAIIERLRRKAEDGHRLEPGGWGNRPETTSFDDFCQLVGEGLKRPDDATT